MVVALRRVSAWISSWCWITSHTNNSETATIPPRCQNKNDVVTTSRIVIRQKQVLASLLSRSISHSNLPIRVRQHLGCMCTSSPLETLIVKFPTNKGNKGLTKRGCLWPRLDLRWVSATRNATNKPVGAIPGKHWLTDGGWPFHRHVSSIAYLEEVAH